MSGEPYRKNPYAPYPIILYEHIKIPSVHILDMGITWNMSHMIHGNMQAGIFICLDRIIGYSFFQKGNGLLLITILIQGAFKHFAGELLREDSL